MADDKDAPQFEKDAKKTRDSFLANLILGKRKEASATPPPSLGSTNPLNDEARKAAGMKAGGKVGDTDKAKEFRHAAAMRKAGLPKKMVQEEFREAAAMKCGGSVKKYASGGSVDGSAQRGKTRGRFI